MTLDQKFYRDRRDRPGDLLVGIVVSILLHLTLFFGYDYWLRAFKPEPSLSSQPIPIEFVEVPPNPKQTPPPQTKRRAANNSVAGGKAKPEQPVAVRLAPSVVGRQRAQGARGARGRGENSIQNSQTERRSSLIAKLKPRTEAWTPTIPQPQRRTEALAKLNGVIAPTTIHSPKRQPRQDLLPPSTASSQVATRATRRISQPKPLSQTSSIAPTNIHSPKRQPRQDLQPRSAASSQLATRTTSKTQFQTQPSRTSGAASRLGGSMSVSSRNFNGNYQAALPNSNRFNRGAEGIDARRDVDMGSYLMQLQQRVGQQWIPGLTENSRQTVVYFAVSRSGQVSGLRIVRPSGSSITDSAALSAVSRAAPFAPLPTGYPKSYINIRFTFNINVSGQLELRAR